MKTADEQARFRAELQSQIQYADPVDITKMLDVAPCTQTLCNVGELQHLFSPS